MTKEKILQLKEEVKDEIKEDLCELFDSKLNTIINMITPIKQDVQEIKTQTQKTNGRVSSLENWKWFITGGLAILSFVIMNILRFVEV